MLSGREIRRFRKLRETTGSVSKTDVLAASLRLNLAVMGGRVLSIIIP